MSKLESSQYPMACIEGGICAFLVSWLYLICIR